MQNKGPVKKSYRSSPDRSPKARTRQEHEETGPQKKLPIREREDQDFDLRAQKREECRIYGINWHSKVDSASSSWLDTVPKQFCRRPMDRCGPAQATASAH